MLEVNKIYNIDCLVGLNQLDDNSVDSIVTSPPYNLGGDFHTFVDGKRVTYGDYSGFKDKLTEEDYQKSQVEALNECFRVLKDDGFMFYVHKNRIVKGSIISPLEWITKTEWNISQVVVLDFGSTANVDKRRFFPVHELMFILNKDKSAKLNNEQCLTDVWKMKKVARKQSGHPATFHIDLPTRCLLASTSEDDIILDPYCGTGTTCIAAIENNRKYIGFEISKEYYDLSQNRVQEINISK